MDHTLYHAKKQMQTLKQLQGRLMHSKKIY